MTATGGLQSAQLNLNANSLSGTGGSHAVPLSTLLDDYFFSTNGNIWQFTITGLINGVYSFYYYAPSQAGVRTGTFTVNGIPAFSLTGDATSPLTQGLNWAVVSNVIVSNGTLTVVSTDLTGIRGLAGVQLSIPEPSSFALFGGGAAALLVTSATQRRRRRLALTKPV